MTQAPEPEPDLVSLSVRVPREMADRLKDAADSADRPVAAHIRRLIKEHLDLLDGPERKAAA